jgi:hypothetical protein
MTNNVFMLSAMYPVRTSLNNIKSTVKITHMYLAGSAQVNCKVLKRCNCPGLGLKCLSSVADVWFLPHTYVALFAAPFTV